MVQYLLSEEFQGKQAREQMTLTSLSNKEINEGFAKDHIAYETLQNKNLNALWMQPIAPIPTNASVWDSFVEMNVWQGKVMSLAVDDDKDINTLLRILAEEARIEVEDVKSTQ